MMKNDTQQTLTVNETFGPVVITFAGGEYEILHDDARPRLAPAWYVKRLNDGRRSARFYTWPDGAFSAFWWGRIEWV